VRHFFEDEMGLPCTFSVARKPGEKTDNESIRQLVREKPPLVMYGSYNERMYLAEAGSASPMKPSFITASFPGAIIRRHIGTPSVQHPALGHRDGSRRPDTGTCASSMG